MMNYKETDYGLEATLYTQWEQRNGEKATTY